MPPPQINFCIASKAGGTNPIELFYSSLPHRSDAALYFRCPDEKCPLVYPIVVRAPANELGKSGEAVVCLEPKISKSARRRQQKKANQKEVVNEEKQTDCCPFCSFPSDAPTGPVIQLQCSTKALAESYLCSHLKGSTVDQPSKRLKGLILSFPLAPVGFNVKSVKLALTSVTHSQQSQLSDTFMDIYDSLSSPRSNFLRDSLVGRRITIVESNHRFLCNPFTLRVPLYTLSLQLVSLQTNDDVACKPFQFNLDLSIDNDQGLSFPKCNHCNFYFPCFGFITPETDIFLFPPIGPFKSYITLNTDADAATSSLESAKNNGLQPQSQGPRGFSRVGGFHSLITSLTELILRPVAKCSLYSGESLIRSCLLCGVPGSGKSLISAALAEEFEDTDAGSFLVEKIDVQSLCTKQKVEIYEVLHRCKIQAYHLKTPTLIILDDLERLCPSKNSDKRTVSAFLKGFHELEQFQEIFVFATCSSSDIVDEAVYRCFEKEIEIETPSPEDRTLIMKKLLPPLHNLSEENIESLAMTCNAFLPSDLKHFCKLAILNALKDEKPLELSHFENLKVFPSGMKSFIVEIPKVHWSDIGGYEEIKERLKECVEWPIKYRTLFKSLNIKPPRGILLYGPPGCSKTLLAKAIATESSMNFISIKGPELFSKYVGDSERAVRNVFKKARQNSPCILFFDEIDSIGTDREQSQNSGGVESRVLSQMLTEMDGVTSSKQVFVIGATNRPDLLDAALVRPGRLDRLLYVPLPDIEARRKILEVYLRDTPLAFNTVAVELKQTDSDLMVKKEQLINHLSEKTKGYSGAEVSMLCREASMAALYEAIVQDNEAKLLDPNNQKKTFCQMVGNENLSCVKVELKHFEKCLRSLKPRVPDSLVDFYDNFCKTHQNPF